MLKVSEKLICILSVLFLVVGCGTNKTNFVAIGTGSLTGIYYPTGNAIAKLINKNTSTHNIKVAVQSTGGSVFNINAIISKELEFGVVQSDRQYQAYHGLEEWNGKPYKQLRSVFSIHSEVVHLLVAIDKNIHSIQDLKGKKVNIGGLGSGSRQNVLDALAFFNMTQKDFIAESVQASDAPSLIQDDRLDAFFYTVGQPNGNIQSALSGGRKLRFIPLNMNESFYKKFPYYAPSKIKVESYLSSLKKDVSSFGVKATLTTREDVPEEVIYQMIKAVFENFEEFKKLHSAYKYLTKENMLEGLSAPLHLGAIRYYKEVGLGRFKDK